MRTVYGEVAQRGTRRTLDLNIRVLKEEEDGLERVSVDFSNIYRDA